MSVFILIYHRMTDTEGGRSNPHCVAFPAFTRHVNHLYARGYSVMRWDTWPAEPTSAHDNVRVAITFDDGHRSDLTCARLLHERGFQAAFFIPTQYIGADDYLDRGALLELRAMNMTLGSHSHSHVALRPLDDRRLSDELRRSRAILEDIVQQPIEHVSFPGGSYDDRVLRSAVEAGYRYCHTSDWGVNRGRQIRRRVLRRTAVVNHYDTADLDALLTLRHYYLRQLGFQAKELTKSTLGVDRYVGLRQAFLSMLK